MLPRFGRDRVFTGAVLLLSVAIVPSLLYLGDDRGGFADTVTWLLAVPAALLAVVFRPAEEPRRASIFWWLIGGAYAWYLGVLLRGILAPTASMPNSTGGIADPFHLIAYLFLVVAFEARPDRREGSPAETDLRGLDTAGALLFLGTLIAYVMPGVFADGGTFAGPRLVAVRLALDVYLVVRAIALGQQSNETSWKVIYGWLGLTFALCVVGDLLTGYSMLARPMFESSSPWDLIWFAPFATQVVAARIHAGGRRGDSGDGHILPLGGRLAPLMAYAFAVPLLHFMFEWLNVLPEEGRGRRDLFVLGFLGLSALLLLAYQRILMGENRRLEHERLLTTEQAGRTNRMEALGRLAGGVAHDFNNLLTVIRGRTELLLVEHEKVESLREDLEAIRDATRRGEGVTRQLLAFGRRQILRPQVLDLGRVAHEMEPLLRNAITEEVRLSMQVRDEAPLIVADQGQLEMALLNLAVNAREAMPGGGRIAVVVDGVELDEGAAAGIPEASPGSYVLLTVQDTGRGMNETVLAKIFEPFFTTKPFGTGSGLGLPTVHGFVRQSGGAIKVESSPGRGATFKIFLPRAQPVEDGLAVERVDDGPDPDAEPAPPEPAGLRPPRGGGG